MSTVQDRTTRTRVRTGRRSDRTRWALLVLGVLVVAFLAVAAVRLAHLVQRADRAQAELTSFKTTLQAGQDRQAATELKAARRDLAQARAAYDSWPVRIVGWVPLAASVVHDAGHLLNAADDVATAGDDALGLYAQVHGSGSRLFHDNTVDLPEVKVVVRQANRMVTLLTSAQEQLHKVHGWWWEPKVGHARDSALAQVTHLRETGLTARRLLRLIPDAVGANGPKSYLVVVLNPAELQPAGGSALNVLDAKFVQGHMTIVQKGSVADLTGENSPTCWQTIPEDPWLHKRCRVLAAADRSPDWRTSGMELMLGYESQFHRHVDGVIGIDPLAMQGLMRQMGAFTTPGYGVVDANNLARKVLIDGYTQVTDTALRHAYNTALMDGLMRRMLTGGHMLGKARALQQAARNGHVQVLMLDPKLQAEVVRAGLLRTLPPSRGDVVGVYTTNANASKVDVWQQRTVDQRVSVHRDGSVEVVRTVTVTNGAPPYAGPGTDPGTGYLTRVSEPRVNLYLSGDATVTGFTVDGQPARWFRRMTERGLRVLSLHPVRLSPGQTATIVVRYTLPPGTAAGGNYFVAVAAQPTYLPVRFTVSVSAPGGCQPPRGWTRSGSETRLSVPMQPFATTVRCGGG